MGATKAVTDATFTSDVLQSDKPVLVDFWAEWCAPCRKVAPVLEEIASELGEKIEIVKLDIDANPRTADRFGVLSLPTVMLFVDGEPRETVYGARPKRHFAKVFAQYL